jgi:FKBP-type peptidyl-prolyl cis-trans isomerase
MKITKVLLILLMFATACSNDTKETPNGFKFKLEKNGEGEPANQNQVIVFNFKIVDSKDSVWIDTYSRGYPEFTALPDSNQVKTADGITQMLTMLRKGDSAVFDMSVKKLFSEMAKAPIPLGVDSTLHLNYSISLRDIVNKDSFEDYRAKIESEFFEFQEKFAKEQLAKDTVLIDDYLKSKGITAQKLPSGIRYVISNPGTSPNAQSGQTVMVNYAGYLMDGTYFDTNIKELAQTTGLYDPAREAQLPYVPFEVTIDQTSVIQGWHEALKQLGSGAKGTFYIPSTLAYGQRRVNEKIGENAILVFDIEVVSINENQ